MEALMFDSNRQSRGQLILVGGVVIATLLIAVGVIFNTALYTDAASTSNTFTDISQSENLKQSIEMNIRHSIQTENKQMDGEVDEDVKDIINGMDTYIHKRHKEYGAVVNIDHESTVMGERVEWNTNSNFTRDNGNTTWEIVSGINDIRKYSITADPTTLASLSNPSISTMDSSAFGIEYNIDQSTNVTQYIYKDNNDIIIHSVDEDDTTITQCNISNSSQIDFRLTTNTLTNGFTETPCRNLWPDFDVETIQYTNTDEIEGTFNYTSFGASTTSDGNLDTATAIYSMKINYRYQNSDLDHSTTTRIAQGEP